MSEDGEYGDQLLLFLASKYLKRNIYVITARQFSTEDYKPWIAFIGDPSHTQRPMTLGQGSNHFQSIVPQSNSPICRGCGKTIEINLTNHFAQSNR